MIWNNDPMLARDGRLEDNVAALLIDLPVVEVLALQLDQLGPAEIPRQLHATASNSSRTR